MSFLVIERGGEAGRRIPLRDYPVTLGRDPSNSIVINDEQASRFHLRIKQRGDLYILEDLESRNGTYVNGDRVLNTTLQNGDKVLVGSTEFLFLASEPNIHIASEIMQFDMQLGESGLEAPIDLKRGREDPKFKPVRLDPMLLVQNAPQDPQTSREIYDLHGNVLVIDNLAEACQALLKSIGRLMPSASRAAVFAWSASGRQLIPLASRHFQKKRQFLLSQNAFEGSLARIQVIMIPASPGGGADRHRLILPMFHNQEMICLAHIERDDLTSGFASQEMELAQVLLHRSAPIFESMLLRKELDGWLVGMVETMIATVEAKDTYTRGHSDRVSRYSMAIADELKLSRDIKRLLMVSSLCHDIGKIGIPDSILKKASLLSAEEYAEMKLHPTIGAEIVQHMPNAKRILSGVKYHHEKWDGTGYPEGLVGEDIPFFGRIVALSDVFDAMVSGRAYSGFLDQSEAVEKVTEEKELFDPEILKAFIRAHENGRLTLKTSTQSQEAFPVSQPSNRISIPEILEPSPSKPKQKRAVLKKS